MEEDWKPKATLALITTAVMLATFVDVLNASIANVALKTIAGRILCKWEWIVFQR